MARDHANRVKQEVDGSHEWTQRAIFSQERFPDVTKECIADVLLMAHFDEDIVIVSSRKIGEVRAILPWKDVESDERVVTIIDDISVPCGVGFKDDYLYVVPNAEVIRYPY